MQISDITTSSGLLSFFAHPPYQAVNSAVSVNQSFKVKKNNTYARTLSVSVCFSAAFLQLQRLWEHAQDCGCTINLSL